MENLTCTKCGSRLPDYKWKANHWCRDCRREYDREYRNKNREQINKMKRVYNASDRGGQIMRDAKQKWNRSEEGQRNRREWKRCNYDRFRSHHFARNAVRYAVKRGALEPVQSRQCVDCAEGAQQYHHHMGYKNEYKLDVIPLCKACHRRRHGRVTVS